MLGSWAEEEIARRGTGYPFLALDSLLGASDLVFANLEAPFGSGGERFEKSYTFLVNPALVDVLTAGHINMVSLANNHIMDFGSQPLQETRRLLRQAGIHFSGAGKNLAEARQPAIIKVDSLEIAFLACSLTFPEEFWATDTTAGTCFPRHTFFFDDIRRLKKEHDFVVVSFHWGSELMTEPKEYQVQLAHQTIQAGADLILGHHPHVVQGVEVYKNKLIAYSLGNFVFGSFSENAKESMLLEVRFKKSSIESAKIIPINVYNKEVVFQPTLLKGEQKLEFLNKLNKLSLELNDHSNVIGKDGFINIKPEPVNLKP
ncbi:MAG: CapA family protein [Calditrichia bacterium]